MHGCTQHGVAEMQKGILLDFGRSSTRNPASDCSQCEIALYRTPQTHVRVFFSTGACIILKNDREICADRNLRRFWNAALLVSLDAVCISIAILHKKKPQ